MDEILQIATTISPIGVIFLLVIVVLQLVNGKGLLYKIRGTQEEKYPKLEKGVTVAEQVAQQLEILVTGQQKIMGNHLHELPEMAEAIRRIDAKNDKIIEILTEIKINTRK